MFADWIGWSCGDGFPLLVIGFGFSAPYSNVVEVSRIASVTLQQSVLYTTFSRGLFLLSWAWWLFWCVAWRIEGSVFEVGF